jgi:hypothetical protein
VAEEAPKKSKAKKARASVDPEDDEDGPQRPLPPELQHFKTFNKDDFEDWLQVETVMEQVKVNGKDELVPMPRVVAS